VASTKSCMNFLEYFLAFYFADAMEQGTQNGGPIQLIADYLIVFRSLLHFDLLVFTCWLIIVVEVSHYRSSPIFPFDNVDVAWLRWGCLDRCIFEHLKKYVGGHRGIAGYTFGQFIHFTIFVSLDVPYCESFEIILHSSDKTQILLKGGIPNDALFFYLSNDHFGITAKDAFLNSDGSHLAEPQQYGLILYYVISALVRFFIELHPCGVAQLNSQR
jgi:hypothetical protein